MKQLYKHNKTTECSVFNARVMGGIGGEPHMMLRLGYIEKDVYLPNHISFLAAIGDNDSYDTRIFVATGKRALSLAKYLSAGKEFSAICEALGQSNKLFIKRIFYGKDAAITIKAEIEQGIRPPFWSMPNSPDYGAWIHTLQARRDLKFDPEQHSEKFGYAKVVMPPEGCRLKLEV